MKLQVVGLDPSMSNFGMVKGFLDLDEGTLTLTDRHIEVTKPNKADKKVVRKNSDDLNRAVASYTALTKFLKGVDLVFVEIPVGSQSARAMASYGMCIGVLSSITLPMIQVTPGEVKKAATGKKTASKDEMILWATDEYPELDWYTKKQKGETTFTGANEHVADAIGAIHAGILTQEFKQILMLHSK